MRLALAVAVAVVATAARSEPCDLSGGVEVPEIEELNQMVLRQDNAAFKARASALLDQQLGAGVQSLFDIYAEGFDHCATIAQRVDAGGMMQSVVLFDGTSGPLFAYWLSVPQGGKFRLLEFNLNSDIDKILSQMR
jgi:hypothetical protein